MKILVVDDEPPIVEAVEYNLRKEGYAVLTAGDAEEAFHIIRTEAPHLIILDIMLPGASGLDLCKRLRRDSAVPVILLTARGDETDRVVGLEIGADDYVTKPFSMKELIARVKSVLRRSGPASDPNLLPIHIGHLSIDPALHEVRVRGQPVELTRREFALLHFLAAHPRQVFSRDVLLDRVWGPDAFVEERTVDVHIRWIRGKIEDDPAHPRYIQTVRGVGYRFSGGD
ncbi:MAG: response regulator [Chthonomonadales bacterium]